MADQTKVVKVNSMPQVKVRQDQAKAERGVPSWTFSTDGVDSLVWSTTEYGIRRVIGRLMAGRSGEAFGGAAVVGAGGLTTAALTNGHDKPARAKIVQAGEVTVEEVVMKSGRTKARERHPGWLLELDGKADETVKYASKDDAKRAAAFAAFGTRGKLGRFAEAEKAFKDAYGVEAKVHLLVGKVVAKDAKGNLWEVGLQKDRAPTFKLLVPAAPASKK